MNGVAPLTDWTPSGGINSAYLDPTSGGKAFYTANLLRPYVGYGAINYTCSCGAANYNSLQTQVNRRFGKRSSSALTGRGRRPCRTAPAVPGPRTNCSMPKSPADRPQVVNAQLLVPDSQWQPDLEEPLHQGAARWLALQRRHQVDVGTPLTVTCTASSAPIGYWTGTPTPARHPFPLPDGQPQPLHPRRQSHPRQGPGGTLLSAERRQLQIARRQHAGHRQHSADAFPGTRLREVSTSAC